VRRVMVFNNVSLDGYFVDAKGDMSWAHKRDPEWNAFASENAKGGGGVLLFGRVTYDLMAGFWPTEPAIKTLPDVAERMNNGPKVVFSRTMEKASWNNTKLIKGDLAAEVRKMKQEHGDPMVIMGSGSIISQLTDERLIDEYQIVVIPIVLGKGRTMFDGVRERVPLKLTKSRVFSNGNMVLWYEPAA
jgi:dihydrofolate reductase